MTEPLLVLLVRPSNTRKPAFQLCHIKSVKSVNLECHGNEAANGHFIPCIISFPMFEDRMRHGRRTAAGRNRIQTIAHIHHKNLNVQRELCRDRV